MTAPLVMRGVGKRYRRRWALRDCTLAIPERAIVGLAGANGAGKSTLLGLTVGLLAPTEGSLEVLGRDPRLEPDVLAGVGFVAREAPLTARSPSRDTIQFARATNPGWDASIAGEFLTRLGRRPRLGADAPGSEAASRSPSRSESGRNWSSSTSRSSGSTRSPPASSSSC